jgi:hypothetical protein
MKNITDTSFGSGPWMTKALTYICLIIDGGLFFLIPALKWIYGIEDGDTSLSAFDTWRSQLVPTRDIYLLTAMGVSLGLILVLTFASIHARRRLEPIEVVGACIALATIILLTIAYTSIPRGGVLG